MSDPVQQYVEVCHCGCARATHFEGATCLGMNCNDCKSYRDRDVPLPKPVRVAAPPPVADDDDAPVTPRVGGGGSHPAGCQCVVCMWIHP